MIFVRTATNYYRDKTGYMTVRGVAKTLAAAKKAFDRGHNCGRFCDYCRAEWEDQANGAAVRKVDHDGAYVEYRIAPYRIDKNTLQRGPSKTKLSASPDVGGGPIPQPQI